MYYSTSITFAQNIDSITPQQWQEDLKYVSKTIKERHENPYNFITEQEFDDSIEYLKNQTPIFNKFTNTHSVNKN